MLPRAMALPINSTPEMNPSDYDKSSWLHIAGLSRAGCRDWDRLAGSHLYSRSDFLRLCGAWPGTETFLMTVSDRGKPAALGCPVTLETGSPSGGNDWNRILAEASLPTLTTEGYQLGPAQAYQTKICRTPDARPAHLEQLLTSIRTAAAAEERAAVAMHLDTADAAAVHRAGGTAWPVFEEVDATLHLPEGGWDGWLGALSSHRRIAVRRECAAFAEGGFSIEHCVLADRLEEIIGPAGETMRKYGYTGKDEDLVPFMERQVECLGDSARLSVCRRDGATVGFCIYLEHGNTAYLRWVGFDYANLVGAAEYFNLVYYDQIRTAPERGIRQLDLGRKAIQAKVLRGAVLEPRWLVDLALDSPLQDTEARIRAHNQLAYEGLLADQVASRGLIEGAFDECL